MQYQKQVSRTGTSNYIPQYLWDVITCPFPWYLLLAQRPWNINPFSKQFTHRENSPVTQSSPEPTLLSWGGGSREKIPPTPVATRQTRSYRTNWATQTLLFSKPLDLAQVCQGNKICSKPALTWKLTCIGISSTLHIELIVEWDF